MKKNIFTVIVGLLSIFGMQAQALQDTTLTRQLELQREFNPTLQDANKINSLPAVREPQVTKANTDYATWNMLATPPIEIALPQPGKIMTDIPFSLQKGYVKLNAGNYANIDGALGYRFLDSETDKVNFMFLHNSTNGNLDYNQDVSTMKIKMKQMDNFAKLNFKHIFEASEFDIYGSFLHSQFNYYGNNFDTPKRMHEGNNQTLSVFNLGAALHNTQPQPINYRGSFSYNYFTTKYGRTLSDESMGGSQVDAKVDLHQTFLGGDNLLGIKGDFTGVFYDEITTLPEVEEISNFIMVAANPYIHFEGYNWKMRLGANLDFVFAEENKFYVSPNVALSVMLTENSSLYLNVIGSVDKNTYLDMYRESRYLLPNTIVKHSDTPFAIDGGTKIGEMDGFRIDIFGGYKKTKNEHFLVLKSDYPFESNLPNQTWTYQEFLQPVFGDLTHSHIGARIHSNIWSPLDVSLKVQKNFYSVSKLKGLEFEPTVLEAWNKPGLEVDLNATFAVTNDVKVMLGYYFANERWSLEEGQTVEMDNINNLNAGALYNINKMFTINLKANNLLNQSYDMWYGHPAQGINVMGGFTFKF
jgi:outer membrane receptor protein involved in Fe transport